ncbi:23S rRNA (guanosine(2251)-2'-O)-methyltransferase RlmB [Caulobacter sp. NIBR2454]|uniref:23S rRNA (guanosine(2251)-2'-O)-methyltransferase RlmB n=1 Tax=Caulobacter sp. NIBR2454 TaxID=3015996 RepID=UPI0022B6A2D7|nr:23S rRNA (guanosine(2251)-2'-O)-methyltransferase RlmB [Caulobacter sp. NIBR2454]
MSSHFERNDRKKGWEPNREAGKKPFRNKPVARESAPTSDWLWGFHAIEGALNNPARPAPKRVLATPDRAKRLTEEYGVKGVEIVDAALITRQLPQGAVHQGMAMRIDPPSPLSVAELGENPAGVIVMLDQITDPQNVGAIFRSAAAFGARGIILQDRHSPALAGGVAKAAVGAIDRLPHVLAVNLSRALEQLADLGWRAVGLDGSATQTLDQVLDGAPTVLVMGSEGDGIRRLVAEHCDVLAKIPMPGGMESLNVSAAAAVALYEVSRPR